MSSRCVTCLPVLSVCNVSSCPQGILVHEFVSYIVQPEASSVLGGVALCLGLVSVELFRVGCLTLSWAVNLRTGIRLKTAFCMLGFHKLVSLRTHSGVSVGQVQPERHVLHCRRRNPPCSPQSHVSYVSHRASQSLRTG